MAEPPLLSSPSNAEIFQHLATPGVVDPMRLQSVKMHNHLVELPVGIEADDEDVSVVFEDTAQQGNGYVPDNGSEGGDSIADYVRQSLYDGGVDSATEVAKSPSVSETSSVASEPVEARSPSNIAEDLSQLFASPAAPAPAPAPAAPTQCYPPLPKPGEAPPRARAASTTANATDRLGAVPKAANDMDYMLGAVMAESVPTLETMRRGAPRDTVPLPEPKSYGDLFRQAMAEQKPVQAVTRVAVGPDYAEKRELLIRLDELRALGFNIPNLDINALTVEDLKSELRRRTLTINTVGYVNMYIGWIEEIAKYIDMGNKMLGNFLPLNNYYTGICEKTKTERFRYAMYQMVLRIHGRSAFNPLREILMVLLAPLLQGIVLKVVEVVAAKKMGKKKMGRMFANVGAATLDNMRSNMKEKSNPVPGGIPGVSKRGPAPPDADLPAVPKGSAFGSAPNPFASSKPKATNTAGAYGGNYPTVAEGTPENEAKPDTSKPKRMRMPDEVLSDMGPASGAVMTDDQMTTMYGL